MRIHKRVFAVFFAALMCVVFLQSSVFASKKKSQSHAVVFVISATTISTESNNQIDLELDIDRELKKSISKYLGDRNFFVAATVDNADYILTYNLEKVEISLITTTDVSFLLTRRNGELLLSNKLRSESIRGWRACVKRTTRAISTSAITKIVANKLGEAGELTRTMAETTATVNRAEEAVIAGGNAERLRQERKEGPISETRPGVILTGLSYYPGGEAKSLSGHAAFEKLLFRKFAAYGKISYLGYEYEDDNGYVWETARGFGGEIGLNVYPNERFRGLYVGLGFGRWEMEGHWIDQKRDKVFYDFNVHIGHKFLVSKKIFVNPSFQLGGLYYGPDKRDGFENVHFGIFGWLYYNVGLAVGTSW